MSGRGCAVEYCHHALLRDAHEKVPARRDQLWRFDQRLYAGCAVGGSHRVAAGDTEESSVARLAQL